MSDNNTQLDAKRKTRRFKRSYNLADFVVIKKKDKKTKKLSFKKLTKVKEPKRGKIRRKEKTTLKKRILKAREEKKLKAQQLIDEIEKLNIDDEEKIQQETEKEQKVEPVKNDEQQINDDSKSNVEIKENLIKHSNNFREFCDHFLNPKIKELSIAAIKDLFRFQENKFQQNPIKAKANRRYVVGFKEVKKFLVVEKLKLIFIAPDLERNEEVDKLVDEIKALAIQHKSFYLFALPRRKLGYLLLKKVPVSVVGIFDYQGTTENVTELIKLVEIERLNYKRENISLK
jgi:selenocysteine insertion sequence-binding protein 2